MTLPKPEPGLVIRYAYLWLSAHRERREEGRKDRPYAVILATADRDGGTRVLVVPVTHSPPADATNAVEIPQPVKGHLGLDAHRSWIVLSESNLFDWPRSDLRRVDMREDGSIAYGFLPPRLFAELRRRFLALEDIGRSKCVPRTE